MKRNTFLKSLLGLGIFPLIPKATFASVNTERMVFTEEMLTRYNVGLFIIKAGVNVFEPERIGYAATVCWKLAYHMIPQSKIDKSGTGYLTGKYGKVSFLTDGWFCPLANTKKQLCEFLNNDERGYRVMTKEEVIYILQNRQQGFL